MHHSEMRAIRTYGRRQDFLFRMSVFEGELNSIDCRWRQSKGKFHAYVLEKESLAGFSIFI